MKFLVDAQLPQRLARWLQTEGHEAIHTSCQKTANSFVPILLESKAVVRGVSCEPILECVDFSKWLKRSGQHSVPTLDWIIVGDESGHRPRPSDLDWYRRIRRQCAENGVAFFLKQFCDSRGHKTETPELDGRRWMEFPRDPVNPDLVAV